MLAKYELKPDGTTCLFISWTWRRTRSTAGARPVSRSGCAQTAAGLRRAVPLKSATTDAAWILRCSRKRYVALCHHPQNAQSGAGPAAAENVGRADGRPACGSQSQKGKGHSGDAPEFVTEQYRLPAAGRHGAVPCTLLDAAKAPRVRFVYRRADWKRAELCA